MRAMGVDVSVARGLDVVVLDELGRLILSRARQQLPQLEIAIREVRPDVVAIDSPPAWASAGRSRPLERQLARLGITMYATPQDPGGHPFYRWMRAGFDVFAAADRCGYPLYRGDTAVNGRAVEVFPHASAVVLRGCLPGKGVPKLGWRRQALADAGVEHDALRTVDQVDAALAALTGMRCLQGMSCVVGIEGDYVLALPVPGFPGQRFEREPGIAMSPVPAREHPKVRRRNQLSDTSTGRGKVVVNRSMSLDGFIAGPGHAMDWVFDFVAPGEFPEIAAATGAMLIGRRTYEVANRMDAGKERGSASSGETYPFSGPVFVLSHEPPDAPDPAVTFLTGDIGEAVATALDAAGGRNLEILGADVAGQCLRRGLVDEILVYVLPVLLGDGIRFSSPGLARIDLEPVSSTRSGAVTILRFRVRKSSRRAST